MIQRAVARNPIFGMRLAQEELDFLDDVVRALEAKHPGLQLSRQDAFKMALAAYAAELGVTRPAPPSRPRASATKKKRA